MSRKRDLDADDHAVWHRVARTVTPRPGKSIPVPPENAPKPKPVQNPAPKRRAAAPPKPNPPGPSEPADVSGEKRVRRGRITPEARIDLHGYTQDEAQMALEDFLARSRARGLRVVLVITGKGRLGEGVIRARFTDWLGSPAMSQHASGYAPAHARHGGSGAFYVRLRRMVRR